jgi:hypothetical protein
MVLIRRADNSSGVFVDVASDYTRCDGCIHGVQSERGVLPPSLLLPRSLASHRAGGVAWRRRTCCVCRWRVNCDISNHDVTLSSACALCVARRGLTGVPCVPPSSLCARSVLQKWHPRRRRRLPRARAVCLEERHKGV